jgi:hypothetical protein
LFFIVFSCGFRIGLPLGFFLGSVLNCLSDSQACNQNHYRKAAVKNADKQNRKFTGKKVALFIAVSKNS